MIIEDKIVVKNYKCFDETGGGFEKIMPLNIIVGKNNSGKSTLIELVEFLVNVEKHPLYLGNNYPKSSVLIIHKLTEDEVLSVFKRDSRSYGIQTETDFDYGKRYINKLYTYQLSEAEPNHQPRERRKYVAISEDVFQYAGSLLEQLVYKIDRPLYHKLFCNITAERDIIPEEVLADKNHSNPVLLFKSNGVGATNLIRYIINDSNQDRNLIKNKLLENLNLIIKPDIEFKEILVRHNNRDIWEIFFVDANEKLVALSKMGSGIKTILLVLLNLIVRPAMEHNNESKSYVFAFEELENNLHPSLQRRLYDYIIKYSKENSCYFFITTHSNIVIDIFGANENAQIIHVTNDGEKSTAKTIISTKETKNILHDLGLKASDILQSNGVIWVEGPSDRNYINKWLEILAPDLKEGLHYSIMFYGGRLLSNLCFDYDWFNKEVIPLLKINHNAFVVMDRDGKNASKKLNETKRRINEEIGENHCWITKGREIENYLSENAIKKWLLEKYNITTNFENKEDTKLEENIQNSDKKIKLKYNLGKTLYSSEIAEYIDSNSIDVLDLKTRLEHLVEVIREWNRM